MKFCSIGTVKTQRELRESQTYMYLFGEESQKPSGFEDVLDILPNARSIATGKNENSLVCSLMAGQSNSKLFLTYINIKNPPQEVQSLVSFPTSFSLSRLDLFKKLCVYASAWELDGNFSSSAQGVLKKGDAGNGELKTSPYKYYFGVNLSAQMVLMPSKVGLTLNLKAKQSVTLSAAQSYTYTYSYFQSGGRYVYRQDYTSHKIELRLKMDGTGSAYSTAISPSPSGASDIERTTNSVPGVYLLRSSYVYQYTDISSGRSTYQYYIPEYSTPTVTMSSPSLPFISLSGTDEEVTFSFGVSASRRHDHIRVAIHEFGTDLKQSGSKVPNTFPSVEIQTNEDIDYISVLSL